MRPRPVGALSVPTLRRRTRAGLDVVADENDWETLGQRFVGAAAARERLDAPDAEDDATSPGSLAVRGRASALDATGQGGAHEALSSNYAAFGALLEAAVQSVDPAVAVPFWAADANADVPKSPARAALLCFSRGRRQRFAATRSGRIQLAPAASPRSVIG